MKRILISIVLLLSSGTASAGAWVCDYYLSFLPVENEYFNCLPIPGSCYDYQWPGNGFIWEDPISDTGFATCVHSPVNPSG